MSTDESLDQRTLSLLAMLAARYPHWTIWYGQTTHHWWALPCDRGAERFVEAPNVKDLIESIEVIQSRRHVHSPPPQPGGIPFGAAETAQARRTPAASWPGAPL